MPTRIALMGCGTWGRHILRDLRFLDCEVSVVARSDASVARATEGGAAQVVPTLGELGPVDGIVIATPEPAHAAHVRAALSMGVPVFCEKPLTVDPSSALQLAREAPDRLFVMDKWRYHPGVEALRDVARSGELGGVVGLRCVRLGWGSAHPTSDSTWHLLVHDLAISIEILGKLAEPVSAVGEVVDGQIHGIRGHLGSDPWVSVEVSSAHAERRRELSLICEGGVAWLRSPEATTIEFSREIGGEIHTREVGADMPLLRELRAFTEHLEGGPPPRSSAAEGAAVVAAVGRMRELAGLPSGSPETDGR